MNFKKGGVAAAGLAAHGSFTHWKKHDAYQKALDWLLRALKGFWVYRRRLHSSKT